MCCVDATRPRSSNVVQSISLDISLPGRANGSFLDLGMLPSDIVSPALHALVKQLTSTGVRPMLVVTLKSSKESAHTRAVQSVQDRFGIPICLRVSPEELGCLDARSWFRRA